MTRTGGPGIGGLITGLVVASGNNTFYLALSGSSAVGYLAMVRDRAFVAFSAIKTVFAASTGMLALGLPIFVLKGIDGPPWLTSAVFVGNTILLALLAAPVVKRLEPYRRTRLLIAAAGLIASAFFTSQFEVHRSLPWLVLGLINLAGVRLLERIVPDSAQQVSEPARV